MKRALLHIALVGICAAILLSGCKAAQAPLPPWTPNARVATVGSYIAAANAVVVGYEQDQKDCATTPALTKCPGVANLAVHAAVQAIQQALTIAQPEFTQWEAAIKANPGATEPANLAAAISTITTVLARLPSLTK